MSKTLFNKNVIETVSQYLEEINSELDKTYCIENSIHFINDEIDMNTVEIFSKSSTDIAYNIIYPEVNQDKK